MSATKSQKSRTPGQDKLAGRKKQHHSQGRLWVPPWHGAPQPRGNWRFLVVEAGTKGASRTRRYPCPPVPLGDTYARGRNGGLVRKAP